MATSLEMRVHWGNGNDTLWSKQQVHPHKYAHPGTYHVTLDVRDPYGAISQASRDVSVQDSPPTAIFSRSVPRLVWLF